MTNNDTRPVIGVALNLTDNGRHAYPLPATTDTLADLNDLALARYAAQWAGTARGGAALAEIAERARADADALAFDTFGPSGATFNRCTCEGCRDLAARDRATRAVRTFDPTVSRFADASNQGHLLRKGHALAGFYTSNDDGIETLHRTCCTVRVRETISHGSYAYTATATGVSARAALAGLLDKSPYYRAYDPTGKTAAVFDRTAATLTETGHAEFGWADYDIVA